MSDWSIAAHSVMQIRDFGVAYLHDGCRVRIVKVCDDDVDDDYLTRLFCHAYCVHLEQFLLLFQDKNVDDNYQRNPQRNPVLIYQHPQSLESVLGLWLFQTVRKQDPNYIRWPLMVYEIL